MKRQTSACRSRPLGRRDLLCGGRHAEEMRTQPRQLLLEFLYAPETAAGRQAVTGAEAAELRAALARAAGARPREVAVQPSAVPPRVQVSFHRCNGEESRYARGLRANRIGTIFHHSTPGAHASCAQTRNVVGGEGQKLAGQPRDDCGLVRRMACATNQGLQQGLLFGRLAHIPRLVVSFVQQE